MQLVRYWGRDIAQHDSQYRSAHMAGREDLIGDVARYVDRHCEPEASAW